MSDNNIQANTSTNKVTSKTFGMSAGTFALTILTVMNLLNYIDRFVPSAVKELFKKDLNLTDAETSLPLTAFVFVYMIASPIFGTLSDKWPRKTVIAFGVALWSFATGIAAFSVGFWSFLIARAFVGVGEAAYASLTPSLLSDYYPKERRNKILTLFYVAIPVGSAIGFAVGGILGQTFGWRVSFLACGLPGIIAAALVLLIKEPKRGAFDTEEYTAPPSWKDALKILSKNGEYVYAVAGYTAVTFASGALADWFPAFLSRFRGLDVGEAGTLVGVSAVIGGLGGTIVGGLLADRLRKITRQPYFALSSLSIIASTVFVVLALFVQNKIAISACMILGQFFLWFYNGPINATLVNCVSGQLRARAFSFSILMIHLLGDAISPTVVGVIADYSNLVYAMTLVPIALVVGSVIWFFGWRVLPET